jgi:hypothetical protein
MTLTRKALLSLRRWYAGRTAQRAVLHLAQILPNEPIMGGSLPRNGSVIRCFRKPD